MITWWKEILKEACRNTMGKSMNVIDLVSQNSNLLSWQQGLQKNNRELILGLSATTKAIVMSSAFDSIEKAVLVTSSYNEAERLASDFIALLGEDKVHTFWEMITL